MFASYRKPVLNENHRKTIGRIARASLLCGVCLALFAGLSILLTVQTNPDYVRTRQSDSDHLDTAHQVIRKSLHGVTDDSPEKLFILTANDLQTAVNTALQRKHLRGNSEFRMVGEKRLDAYMTLQVRDHSPRLFWNIHLVADSSPDQMLIKRLRIGHLSIPAPIIGWFVRGLLHLPVISRYGELAEKMIKRVHLDNGRLAVTVNWNRELLNELSGLLIDVADRDRLIVYYSKLADLLDDGTQHHYVRLGTLVQPLFALARERSGQNGQPVEENRAAILVLCAYTNGKSLSHALSVDRQPIRRGVLLNKRIDTAQHFLTAAAMAMSGQGTLVEMIGLAKELQDTHDGSGFSFIDLAADEAGALFGRSAVRSAGKARRFQEILSLSADESQFIPPLRDLPESMNSGDFSARFKSVDSPEFQSMKEQITNRIQALRLYQPI